MSARYHAHKPSTPGIGWLLRQLVGAGLLAFGGWLLVVLLLSSAPHQELLPAATGFPYPAADEPAIRAEIWTYR